MKTSELTGAVLDWAVAKCEGLENENGWTDVEIFKAARAGGGYRHSANWAQGGAIIERDAINLRALGSALWEAETWSAGGDQYLFDGETPLIAAMRCYVASKLGDEMEVPEELMSHA